MTAPNCTHCGRILWTCRCEHFGIPEVKQHWPHKYVISDKIQLPKNRKYRVVFKNGQFATETI